MGVLIWMGTLRDRLNRSEYGIQFHLLVLDMFVASRTWLETLISAVAVFSERGKINLVFFHPVIECSICEEKS